MTTSNILQIAQKTGILILLLSLSGIGLTQTVDPPPNYFEYTINHNDDADPGYLFMFARPQTPKYPGWLLILDNFGTPVYYKYLPYKSGAFALQRSGLISFLRDDGVVNQIYLMDSTYQVVDSVWMETYELDTHDFIAMENGHFLIFGLDVRTVDMSAVIPGGDPNASVKGCVIQELDAGKNVVFEWNSWDHYEITDTYKDLTASSIDYVHPNSLEIDNDGNILLIARGMNEVTKIDRQTGDIIWRLGGKNNQFDFADTTHLFSQPHDFRRLPNGNYTIFDNGNDRDPAYSRAVEYVLDEGNKTIELVWEYDAGQTVFSRSGGSTRRLPSGNTIVGYGGQISDPATTEVHPDGSIAFQLSFLDDAIRAGRAVKFPWKTTLFEAVTDNIDFGEWDGYTEALYLLSVKNNGDEPLEITSFSVHGTEFYVDEILPFTIPANDSRSMKVIFYPDGAPEGSIFSDLLTLNSDRDTTERIAIQVHLEGTYPDITSPVVALLPESTTIPVDTMFHIQFNEPVRMSDDTEITDANISSVLTFKESDASGEDVAFNATVNFDKTEIGLTPVNTLTGLQDYYLAIEAMVEDYYGNTILKSAKTYTTTSTTGTSGLYNLQTFVVYPNPVREVLYFESTFQQVTNLSIYNGIGKIIGVHGNLKKGTTEIDLSDYPKGIYFLKIESSNTEPVFRKIVKE